MSKIAGGKSASYRLSRIAFRFILEKWLPRACDKSLRGAAGGAYRDRTDDPLLAKQVLSQLS